MPLKDQNRADWDPDFRARGIALAERAATLPGAASYTVQAAITAVHAEASSIEDTDWLQIVVLYGLLERCEPGPVVQIGKAVALGRTYGPRVGLDRLVALAGDARVEGFRAFPVARALTLEELGDPHAAARSYRRALELPGNAAEERFRSEALDAMSSSAPDRN